MDIARRSLNHYKPPNAMRTRLICSPPTSCATTFSRVSRMERTLGTLTAVRARESAPTDVPLRVRASSSARVFGSSSAFNKKTCNSFMSDLLNRIYNGDCLSGNAGRTHVQCLSRGKIDEYSEEKDT